MRQLVSRLQFDALKSNLAMTHSLTHMSHLTVIMNDFNSGSCLIVLSVFNAKLRL